MWFAIVSIVVAILFLLAAIVNYDKKDYELPNDVATAAAAVGSIIASIAAIVFSFNPPIA